MKLASARCHLFIFLTGCSVLLNVWRSLLILKDVSTEGIVAPSLRKDEERINNSGVTLCLLPASSLSTSLLPSSVLTDFSVFITPAL